MSIVHSNITTPGYSSAQQETVQGKSRHGEPREQHWIKISTEPRIRIFNTVQSERTDRWKNNPENHILRADPPVGPSQSVAQTSTESTNLNIISLVHQTNRQILNIGSPKI